MYNFKRLISKYSKSPCYLLRAVDGHYDYSQGGIWVEGEVTTIEFSGAVVPLKGSEIDYREGAMYTNDDRKLYTYEDLEIGDKIDSKGLEYTVSEIRDYSDYDSELKIYILRRGGR